MNATSHTPNLISAPPDTSLSTLLNTIDDALGASLLALPFRRLTETVDALVQDGQLGSVSVDLTSPQCPCLLVSVASSPSPFYVEMFLEDADDGLPGGEGEKGEDEEAPVLLCVLMNWMGPDTEPAFWETELDVETDTPDEDALDLREVLGHILWATRHGV